MIVDVLSVFPEMFENYMSLSIMSRAQKKGAFSFAAHDLRKWTHDKHRSTDDEPYGGGQGLLMTCPPVFEAVEELSLTGPAPTVVFFTPTGTPFTQDHAKELATHERLLMVCGRYEGFDERVYTLADRTYSLGDYVLTGGELAAMVVTDAVVRLLDGVLGDEFSAVDESFEGSLLEYPQYTRPASYKGMDVPEVLLSGDHGKVAAWRREQSVIRTAQMRPDLLCDADLTQEERALAKEIMEKPRS